MFCTRTLKNLTLVKRTWSRLIHRNMSFAKNTFTVSLIQSIDHDIWKALAINSTWTGQTKVRLHDFRPVLFYLYNILCGIITHQRALCIKKHFLNEICFNHAKASLSLSKVVFDEKMLSNLLPQIKVPHTNQKVLERATCNGLVRRYTSRSISFSTTSTVRTRRSPVTSSTYSSVFLLTDSSSTFSLSRTVRAPLGFSRTASRGKSAEEGRSGAFASSSADGEGDGDCMLLVLGSKRTPDNCAQNVLVTNDYSQLSSYSCHYAILWIPCLIQLILWLDVLMSLNHTYIHVLAS